jgi:subtilisin
MSRSPAIQLVALCLTALVTMLVGGCGAPADIQRVAQVTPAAQGGVPADAAGNSAVIIGFKAPPGNSERALVQGHKGQIKQQFDLIPAIAADLPAAEIAALEKDPRVDYVEADAECFALEDTLPWGVDQVNAEVVWGGHENDVNIAAGRPTGSGVGVAIIDTGINYTHPDLAPNCPAPYGANFVDATKPPLDDNGHGSHCAGIVAAADDGSGVIGAAPRATLYALKVLNASGSGSYSSIIAGLNWCVTNKATYNIRVASMSLGGSTVSTSLQTACKNAYNAGVLLVAAAGNGGPPAIKTGSTVTYPAKYSQYVVAVSATDSSNKIASFSSTGSEVELAAPGVSIPSDWLGTGLNTISGTSMACPHVSGVAALVSGKSPSLLPPAIRQKLDSTATDLGTKGRDNTFGYGLVNALNATK